MFKKIEFVPFTEPQPLREKLQEMVNEGWEIRGFVSFNSGNNYDEQYAVMERITQVEPMAEQEMEMEEPEHEKSPYPAPPKKKEISISLGGN